MSLLQFDSVDHDLRQHERMMYPFPRRRRTTFFFTDQVRIILDFYNWDRHLVKEIVDKSQHYLFEQWNAIARKKDHSSLSSPVQQSLLNVNLQTFREFHLSND